MTDIHLTGLSSLLAALALLIHAIRAMTPVVAKALADRSASKRLDSETHAKIETGREDTARDLRTQRDQATAEVKELRTRVAHLDSQLRALSAEFIEFRARAVR